MPRYAKGSLPEAIYSDLMEEMMIDRDAPPRKHNHMEDVGINTDNFLTVVGDIVKGH